jgi:thiol-disulfide isomerase/thioredoxin
MVLAIVSTQCGHCAAAAAQMEAISKEFPRVAFAAVAFDESADVAAWSKKLGLTLPVFKSDRQTVVNFLGLEENGKPIGTPQMVYVDAHGMIRAQSERSGSPLLQTADYMRMIVNGEIAEQLANGDNRRVRH